MRFKKDKVKRSLNFKNMLKFRDSYRWLMIVLVISNIIFATLFLTKRTGAGNVVSAVGTIEVYDSDGVSPLTSYDFPLFTGGIEETFLKYFFVNNTGNQPVYVYWNISTSSIAWEVSTPNLDAYDYYEDGARKYGFAIRQNFSTPTDYWHPNREAILLDVSEGIKLRLELYYTGEPNTAETFTMTLSFSATSEGCTHDIAVINVTSSKTIVGQSYFSPINVIVENQGDFTETFNVTAYYGNLTITPEQWDTFWSMGDVNEDGYINQTDVELIAAHLGTSDPQYDIDESGFVDVNDLAICGLNQGKDIWTYFLIGGLIGKQTVYDLPAGNQSTLTFTWNTAGVPYNNWTITANATILPIETDTADNTRICWVVVTVSGDVNGDYIVDGTDLSDLNKAYGSTPNKPNWNPNCDLNDDNKVDALDLFDLSKNYGKTV